MRRLSYIAVAAATLLAGCVVQSFHPFFTPEARVSLSGVAGRWERLERRTNEPVWVFGAPNKDGEFVVESYDGPLTAKLRGQFFKAGDRLFCDFLPGDLPADTLNVWYIFHLRPAHTVSLVATNNGELSLTPLNYDWLHRSIQSNEVAIAHLKDDDGYLFTATTAADWMRFLQQHAANTNAFPTDDAIRFRRPKTP